MFSLAVSYAADYCSEKCKIVKKIEPRVAFVSSILTEVRRDRAAPFIQSYAGTATP